MWKWLNQLNVYRSNTSSSIVEVEWLVCFDIASGVALLVCWTAIMAPAFCTEVDVGISSRSNLRCLTLACNYM